MTRRAAAALVGAAVAALPLLLAPASRAQDADRRVGSADEPVAAALAHSATAFADDGADRVVLGRADVFADNLAGAPLTGAGRGGPLLLTTGGRDAALSPGVADEVERVLGAPRHPLEPGSPGGCVAPVEALEVILLGGPAAVSERVQRELEAAGWCVGRLAGPSRIETAVAVADSVVELVGAPRRVLLARSDDWADAATGGAAAARSEVPVLVTPPDGLHPAVAAFLDRHPSAEVVLLGGEAALSEDVARAVGDRGRRVAGPARDATAAEIARQVFEGPAGGVVLANGYVEDGWVHALAVAPLAAAEASPVLYAERDVLPSGTADYLAERPSDHRVLAGPPSLLADSLFDAVATPTPTPTSGGDLAAARVALERVASLRDPLALVARPDTGELYIAEQSGSVRVLRAGAAPTVLDLTGSVTAGGEQGLLGITFSPDASTFYAHYTNRDGDGQVDEYDVDGEIVAASRRTLLVVPDPASNHNGGHVVFGPDGYLYIGLGDGGGAGDPFDEGQNPSGLLGSILRIDPLSAEPYAIPPDNPFVGGGGAPEVWAYGLRNPWRFSFDRETGDLWIADVGQGEWEEIDHLPAGTGSGANLGWSFFEGSHDYCAINPDAPRCGQPVPPTVFPVHEHSHDDGWCSITGGVVYRGTAIPALRGAYLYGDFCRPQVLGLTLADGRVSAVRELGIEVGGLSSFGEDASGEVYLLSLRGDVFKLVPG